MLECNDILKRTVPLYKVVAAAIVDSFEDIGRTQQVFSHWGARKLRELCRQTLKTNGKKATLTVNRNTNTATLPPDFDYETFVGVIVDGKKIRLKLRPELVDEKNIEDIPCEDKCERCQQPSSVCNDLTITEDTVLVVINDTTYEQTVIKKLYPDGSYYLETRIPVLDIESDTVIYRTTKELIAAIDLKPCGCIDETEENIETIKCCCPDVYYSYFASCDNSCTTNYGGYRVFPESGLIQFDGNGKFTKVYLEYQGFMAKIKGQYHVPEVAFETIVEWIKFRNIDGKRSSPNVDKQWRWAQYKIARGNMDKEMGRISLGQIIQAATSIPKFDLNDGFQDLSSCATSTTTVVVASISQAVCSAPDPSCPVPATKGLVPFQLAVMAGTAQGVPQPGTNVYQNDALKGAIGLNMIIVNNTNETILANQFTFNSTTGTITRYQGDGVTANNWATSDILVANFSKFI